MEDKKENVLKELAKNTDVRPINIPGISAKRGMISSLDEIDPSQTINTLEKALKEKVFEKHEGEES